jgi:aldehyde:ferredoxin oxidoreductase
VLSSLVVCFFARGVYQPDTVRRALAATGRELGGEELEALGRRVYAEKYAFKRREGFDLSSLRIPKRITETPSPSVPITEELLRETLDSLRRLIESEPA